MDSGILQGVDPHLFFSDPEIPESLKGEIREELWLSGDIRFLLYPGPQTDFYDRYLEWEGRGMPGMPTFCMDVHRGLGKTFLAVAFASRLLILRPAAQVYLFAPVGKQAGRALNEQWRPILNSMPAYLRPDRHEKEHYSVWNPEWGIEDTPYNRSNLYLAGTEQDMGESARGGGADLVLIDEVRNIRQSEYLNDDILLPMLERKPGAHTIMLSSQPPDGNHAWITRWLPEAEEDGTLFFCSIETNPLYDPKSELKRPEKNIQPILHKLRHKGGRDSITYRREYLCEQIAEKANLIVPEFQDFELPHEDRKKPRPHSLIYKDRQRPDYYHGFVFADFGGSADYHSFLSGYYDFEHRLIVFCGEKWLIRQNTRVLAESWKELRFRTLESPDLNGNCLDVLEVGEAKNPQLLLDMAQLQELYIGPSKPMEREAAQGLARQMTPSVRIHESCTNLIFQLRNGQRDPKNFKFLRSEKMGHCDAVATFVIAIRHILETIADRNPFPPDPRPARDTHQRSADPGPRRGNVRRRRA